MLTETRTLWYLFRENGACHFAFILGINRLATDPAILGASEEAVHAHERVIVQVDGTVR